MENILPPMYPAAPDLTMPDLNLANPTNAMASMYSVNALPDPVRPPVVWPVLSGDAEDIARMGIDGAEGTLRYDLNLAGAEGVPAPAELVQPEGMQGLNAPTFGLQDYTVPTLQPSDLTGPGIDYVDAREADPALPDLAEYEQPRGLDVRDTSILAVDAQMRDLLQYESPLGLNITRDPLLPDPTLPDLQHPAFTRAVQMSVDERPGSLDPTALSVMDPATAAQVADKDYPEVFMDQDGVNNTRARHMTLLMRGVREEI